MVGVKRDIIWGDWNRQHLTERGSERGFTLEDVEAVLRGDASEVVPIRARDFFLGMVRGRRLTVVAMTSDTEVYPLTAFWADEARWRALRERHRPQP